MISHFEAWISALGALGLYPVISRLLRSPKKNPHESSLLALGLAMFGIFLIRIPYLTSGSPFFGGLTYLIAGFMPLIALVHFEILLRRHMPLFIKLLTAFGSVFFSIAAATGIFFGEKSFMIPFGIFGFLVEAAIIYFCYTRPKKEYSAIENSLIELSVFSLVILVPFFISDMAQGAWGVPRMAVVGALLFAYTSMYNHSLLENSGFLLKQISKSLLFSLLLTLALATLFEKPDFVRLYILFFVISLISKIFSSAQTLDGEDNFVQFVTSLSEADKKSREGFLSEMNRVFGRVPKLLFSESDLKPYKKELLFDLFEKHRTHIINLHDVRLALFDSNERVFDRRDREAYEQILDLLEKSGMNFLCRLGIQEPRLVAFHVPLVAYTKMIYVQTQLIVESYNLIEKSESLTLPHRIV